MGKFRKVFTNIRVIILLVLVALSLLAIRPSPLKEGVAIRSVSLNSSASLAGIPNPNPNSLPMSREVIISIDNSKIKNIGDYQSFISNIKINKSYQIKTNKNLYKITTKESFEEIQLNETENKTIVEIIKVNESINGSIVEANKTIEKLITVPKILRVSHGLEDIGLKVYDAPQTNIRKGLDLQGGTRVLLQPEYKLSDEDIATLIDNMKERLNVFGLSDIIIRDAGDLSGNQYVLVEIAGANEDEVKGLLAKQGKFEAKIGNETVFIGGRDIKYVCRSSDCAGIDTSSGCGRVADGWSCRFRFSISLSPESAEKQASLTRNLDIVNEDNSQYLSEYLVLYLDDLEVDRLRIGAELKGRAETDIQISGSGFGRTNQEAISNSLINMKRLQTILITGSLPVKLNIIKTDTISPILGEGFLKNALLLGVFSVLVVIIMIFIRYRMLKVAIPMAITIITELTMLLGFGALFGWNLDLAAIAGIIIAVGSGVDHQIVITDETLRGDLKMIFNWKERIKNAFSIIIIAFFTNSVAMVPLLLAGAGLLKGFAIISIVGMILGVFVSRPAYASIIEILLKE